MRLFDVDLLDACPSCGHERFDHAACRDRTGEVVECECSDPYHFPGDPLLDTEERRRAFALDRHVESTAHPVTERAAARWGHPLTSHEAAASVTVKALRASQHVALGLLRDLGPSTLEEVVDAAHERECVLSDSRVRSAVAELVALGLVHDLGDRRLTRRRRSAVVWHLVPEPQGEHA